MRNPVICSYSCSIKNTKNWWKMCRHGHSNTQQTQHFPHWRIYHRIQIWWNCQNICYFHTCQQQQQQLRRLYIAHRCMDFCRAGTPKTDWSSGLDWEELFLEHISVRGGNCLLLSFLSPREGFQWNKKRKKKKMGGSRLPTVRCRYTESEEHRRAEPRRKHRCISGWTGDAGKTWWRHP